MEARGARSEDGDEAIDSRRQQQRDGEMLEEADENDISRLNQTHSRDGHAFKELVTLYLSIVACAI